MDFKRIVFVFALLAYMHDTCAFTYEVVVKIIDKTNIPINTTKPSDSARKIMFFSDHHKKSLLEQEQVESLVRYLQEHKDTDSFHILLEEASEFHKQFASGYEILYTLNKHIKQAQPPLTHVTLDNVEVRHVAGFSRDIFVNYDLYNQYRRYKLDDAKKAIGTIIFQDILDEFDQIKQSLATYYLNYPDQAIVTLYAEYMKRAERHCEEFKRKISNPDETVLAYVKAQSQLLNQQEGNEVILAKDIQLSFAHLFDLNLLKNILASESHNILVFAGGDHTREIINMLDVLKVMTIHEVRNVVIKPVLHPSGFTLNQEVVSPVTGEQVAQAFSAQPVVLQPWITGSPAQLFFVGAIMSGVLYWCYTQYKATDEDKREADDCLDGEAEDKCKAECLSEAAA